jgi:predicted transposase YbfD/YdcC
MDSKTRVETHYFISDVEENTKRYANYIPSHWGTENSLHWVLNVPLKEDD